MATRAGVSEGIFREVFPTIEDCYRSAYQEGVDRLSQAVTKTAGCEQGWLERVRSGLVVLLGFFEDEPAWARLLLREAPVDVALTLTGSQRLHDVLRRLLDEPGETAVPAESPIVLPVLTGELVAGGVFSVIRTSVLAQDGGRLVELAPSLMAFIALQYGRPDLAGGLARTDELARAETVSRTARLPIRATHRTTMVLRAIARAPYSNNREVAQAAGLADEGQTSKLLARLERKGVIENVGIGAMRGEPNAWLLTPTGRRAVELLAEGSRSRTQTSGIRARGVA